MWNEIFEVTVRTVITVVVLFILGKLMGKKQIAQLNIFDYIVGITIGSIASEIALDTEKQFVAGVIAMIIYAGTSIVFSILSSKSIVMRRWLTGVPTILIENGKIIESGLKKVKYDVNELLEEARGSGYFDIGDISYAVMEATGTVSFLPKDEQAPVVKKDLDLKVTPKTLTANVIIDGNIMPNNLKGVHKDEPWLLQQIKLQGFDSPKGILLATLDNNEKVTIYKKEEKANHHTILE